MYKRQGKIRPGARGIFNDSYRCTLNFIYTDNQGALYIGTAGHCAPNYNPRKISAAGVADIGEVAFTTGNGGVGNDFALIRIDPAYVRFINPTLCHWGGPTNLVDQGELLGNAPVLHYGWGFVYGNTPVTRPREGVLASPTYGPNAFTFVGLVAPGDSGSGVETAFGGAIGVVTHTLIASGAAPLGLGVGIAMRVDKGLAMASASTGHTYTLVQGWQGVDLTGVFVP